MCKEKDCLQCDILSSYLKSLDPKADINLLDEAKEVLECDVLWWSITSKNDWLCFYRDTKTDGAKLLRADLQENSYSYSKEGCKFYHESESM